jgi:hypothetical protein
MHAITLSNVSQMTQLLVLTVCLLCVWFVLQFGSSSQAVFFKMRVAGVLHIFQFETRQGEDICMALQTHINDIMMKRYSKVGKLQLLMSCPFGAKALTQSA